jgi:MFS family permease
VQVHQTKYLNEIGFPSEVAAYALGMVGLTGSVGQILLGYVSDRVGREWAWTISMLGFALCYALLWVMKAHPTPVLMYGMVTAQGLLGYGMASVFGMVPAELFAGKHYGAISGTLSVAASLGAGLGPWVTGLLYLHRFTGAPERLELLRAAFCLRRYAALRAQWGRSYFNNWRRKSLAPTDRSRQRNLFGLA